MSCGHKCLGFCGEACPNVCSICDSTISSNLKYLKLPNCDHAFESKKVEEIISGKNVIGMPECPKCGSLINVFPRFKELLKTAKAHIGNQK